MITPPYTLNLCNSLPKYDRSISLLCWAYNEEKLIGDYLVRANNLLKKHVEDYEIIVVDDGSTDRTNEIIKNLMKEIPQIKLFTHSVNLDIGYASQKAIFNASKEYLFWQTVDWSYDITNFRIFLELLKSYDIVTGVRHEPVLAADKYLEPFLLVAELFNINHLTKRSDTVSKAIVSVINYLLIRLLFGIPLSDYQNVVFYPTKLIQSITYEAKSAFYNPEGLIKSYWKGASIIEVPISFLPRQLGKAKGTRPKAIKSAVWDIFRLWFKWIVLKKKEFIKKGTVRGLQPHEWPPERNS